MMEVVLPFGLNSYNRTSMLRSIWRLVEILTISINILPPVSLKIESKPSGRPIRVIGRHYAQLLLLSSTAPPDLIIDDASHLYSETKTSFETLFPQLRPGGLYIIEDWSWGCWPNLPFNFQPIGTELPKLIHQIVDAAGSMEEFLSSEPSNEILRTINPLIASVTTYADIVVIERGGAAMTGEVEFNLEDYTTFRPYSNFLGRCISRARFAAAKLAKTKFSYRTHNK